MSISLEHRRIDGIHVVSCTGRIVEGAESDELREYLDDLMQYGPNVIVNVGTVDFVDSSGLGLLVRYTMRARNAHGALKLCGVSSRFATILKATRLDRVFDAHESEADAIAAFYQRPAADVEGTRGSEILCVVESIDLQALVRELLMRAGFGVRSASNLPDAVILLRVTRPRLIVIDQAISARLRGGAAGKFAQLTADIPVIELPATFSGRDPGDAAQDLLGMIQERSA